MENNIRIINAKVDDVINGNYIITAADGTKYELAVGTIEVKNGQLIEVTKNKYLQLVLPEDHTVHELDNSQEAEEMNNNALDEQEQSASAKAEWPDNATKLLIELYREKKGLVEQRKIKTLKRMWAIIQQGINNQGYSYTAAQCENKWKALERAFKNKTENNNKSGRGRKTCAYERELSDILLERASVIPPVVMDAKRAKYGKEVLEELRIEITESENDGAPLSDNTSEIISENMVHTTPTAGRSNTLRSVSTTAKELVNLRRAIEKRTEERKNADDRKFAQRENMIKQLERRNELLEKLLAERNQT